MLSTHVSSESRAVNGGGGTCARAVRSEGGPVAAHRQRRVHRLRDDVPPPTPPVTLPPVCTMCVVNAIFSQVQPHANSLLHELRWLSVLRNARGDR